MTISFPSFDVPVSKWSDGTEEPADDIYVSGTDYSLSLGDLQYLSADELRYILQTTDSDTLADHIAELLQ